MARLNDTAALKGIGPCCDVTVNTRKIDNGYIEQTSSYNPKTGSYKSSEVFKTSPNGDAERYGAVGCENLSDTKKYLGNDV